MPVNTRITPIDLEVKPQGGNVLIEQASQLRREREAREREAQAAKAAEARAAAADAKVQKAQRQAALADAVEQAMLREYGDVELISGSDSADLRRDAARRLISEQLRGESGKDVTDEDIIAVVRHFGNRDWVSVSAIRGGAADPSAPAASAPAKGGKAKASTREEYTGVLGWLQRNFGDAGNTFIASVARGTGGLVESAGQLANDIYDSYQQSKAIDAEVARLDAADRARGVLSNGMTLDEFRALSPEEQRKFNAGAVERRRRQAEKNISAELARLDKAPDNPLTWFAQRQLANADRFRANATSPEEQDRQQRMGQSKSVPETLGIMLEDPLTEAANLGGFLLGSGGAAGGARSLAARTLGKFGRVAMANTLRSGAAVTATSAMSVGAASTGDITSEVRTHLDGLDDETLKAMPIYADALERLGDDASAEEVRTLVTETLVKRAQVIGSVASLGGLFIGGQSELLASTAARAVLARSFVPFTKTTTGGAIKGLLREGVGEAIEEGGQELAGQVGRGEDVDYDRIAHAAGVGAAVGGPLGAAAGRLAARGARDSGVESGAPANPLARGDLDPDVALAGATGTEVSTQVDEDAVEQALVYEEGQVRQDQDFLSDAESNVLIGEGAANPVEIVSALSEARKDIGKSLDETAAELKARDTQEAAAVREQAQVDLEGDTPLAAEARERLAFDALADAFTAREPGFSPFINALQSDPTVELRTGTTVPPDAANPLVEAQRRKLEQQAAASAVGALPRTVVPVPITEAVARVSQRSSRLMAGIQYQFTAKDVDARREAIFNRLVERRVQPRQARDLSAQIAEVPRGEIAQVLEDLRAQQPGLTQALDAYSSDFETFRRVSGYRRQLNRFVKSQQGGDTNETLAIARSKKFVEAIEQMTPALEAAGITVPTTESIAEAKTVKQAKVHGPERIARIASGDLSGTTGQDTGRPDPDASPDSPQGGISRKANTAPTYKDVWDSFKNKPLAVDNAFQMARATAAAIPQLVHRADNADVLRLADNVRHSRGLPVPDVTVHDRFGMSVGLAKQYQGIIADAVTNPMRDALESLARDMEFSMEQANKMASEFLFARHVPERIAVQRLQEVGVLTEAAKRDWIVIDKDLRNGDITPADARQQLEAIFDDPASYKRPKDNIPLDERRYNKDPKGMTSAEAQDTVQAALALEGQRPHLERIAELSDRAAEMTRKWYAEANVGGQPIQNIMEMYGWKHYVPVAVAKDNAGTLFESDAYSPRNAGRQRMNGVQDMDIQSPIERMYISMTRASLLAAEQRFMSDLAGLVTDLNNAGFATIETNQAPTLNPKTGRHFHEKMPSASETNKFVNHKPDGTYDVITVNDKDLLALLDKRYQGQDDGAITAVVRKGTRGLGRLYTNGPDYMFGTGMWRDIQESAAAALVDSGDRTLASKARVVANHMENQMRAAMSMPELTKFYGASPTKQAEMAAEFAQSDNPLLKAAATRYKLGGIVGFRSQLGPDGLFMATVEGGDPLKARNALQRAGDRVAGVGNKGLHLIDTAMTTLDNQARDAAFATMVANGVSAEKAVALTRNIMNFDQRANVPGMSKISAFYAFVNTSIVGAQTAVTRRLFRGNDVPTKTVVSDSGVEVVGVDWAAVPGAVSKSQLAAYVGMSGLSTLMMVWGAGYTDDEATGERIPVASTIPASRYMTAGMIPEIFDENGEIEPTRIPVQYGVQMLVHSTAAAASLWLAGTHSSDEIGESLAGVWLSVFNPFGRVDPAAITESDGGLDTRVAASSLAPSLFAPIVQALTNTSGFGTPLFRESFDTQGHFFADPRGREEEGVEAYVSTPELYSSMSDAVRDNGLAQLFNLDAPETMRNLSRSYLGYAGRALDNVLKEAQRKAEDPSYESSDWARNLSGSPVRSVNDARYYDQGRVSKILDGAYGPIKAEFDKAHTKRKAGDTAAMGRFKRDYPEWSAMSVIAKSYFKATRDANEKIMAERERAPDANSRERIHDLYRERERARTVFLRRWFEQFPDTFPRVED